LVAEVIEFKTKPSRPHGEIAQDAFGHVFAFEDKGDVRRAILALGRQDVDVLAIKPRIKADVLGASSDHLILDVKGPDLEVGDEVRFDIGYSALLRGMTSPYVEKVYLPRSYLTIRRSPCVDYLLYRATCPSARLRRQTRRALPIV
jgi:predicted amino acid racemase